MFWLINVKYSAHSSRWGRDFPPVQTGPGAHPASCKMGTGSFPGVKCGRSVLLTTHSLLVPRSWKSRAIPLPTLWVTPGLKRDHFTFTLLSTFGLVCTGPQFCQISRNHLEILVARKVTWKKFYSEDPKFWSDLWISVALSARCELYDKYILYIRKDSQN